jgi:endonuclease/exonuclease/phosphatase (EEP) superfamily protein YafD
MTDLSWLVALLCAAALLIGRLGTDCAACDATNLAFPALAIAGCLMLIVLLATRSVRRDRPTALLALGCVFVVGVWRDQIPVATRCVPEAEGPLKIVAFNVWKNNRDPTRAAAWIEAERADIVVLVEAKERSAALLQMLRASYPYQLSCHPRVDCSTRILSRARPIARYPLARGDVENRGGLSAAAIDIETRAGPATIVAVHLSRPLPIGRQQSELAMLRAKIVRFDPARLIVAGDFNATADSLILGDFAASLGLFRLPTGITWPTYAVANWLPSLWGLDHIFVGRGWSYADTATGPVIGSDHRPVTARLCAARV